MNYTDPGDDEREAMRMREEAEKWTWQAITGIAIAVGGPLAILVTALVWRYTT